MKTITHPQLADFHTFAIKAQARVLYLIEQKNELKILRNKLKEMPFILGEGANLLFVHAVEMPLVKLEFAQYSIQEERDSYVCRVAAGKNWHDLVVELVEQGIAGLENLALIPGSVGAAPIQNIGAYGVEFCQLCESVEVFDWQTGEFSVLTAEQCQFGYRDSIFKTELGRSWWVTEITLRLPKSWQVQISYQGIVEQCQQPNPSAQEVMQAIIKLREQKLPNPKRAGNAGSFFKNPTVTQEKAEQLKRAYPSMPGYAQEQGVKIPAACLIDQLGWKGRWQGGAQVHAQQALVIVNGKQATSQEVVELAYQIQQQVKTHYGIELLPEVRFIGGRAEMTLEQAYASTRL